MQWVSGAYKKVCEVNTAIVCNVLFYTENVTQLGTFQLRLIDLNGNVIQRPDDITNTEFTASGRLEVLYSGHWGTVCSNGFTNTSREVACKQLGYMRYIKYNSASVCIYIYLT